MTATETLVRLMDMTAGALAEGEMPADPFEAADLLDAAKHLGAELATYMARTRAHRTANATAWAQHTATVRAGFDPEGMPPPPPPPPPPPDDPPPPPEGE